MKSLRRVMTESENLSGLVVYMEAHFVHQFPHKYLPLIPLAVADALLRACIASTFRLVYNFKIAQGLDFSFNVLVMALGALTELTMGIIVACLPVFPRFFQHHKSILSTKLPSPSWSRVTTSANKLIPLVGRGSKHEKHEQWSQTMASVLPSESEMPESSRDTKEVLIDIPEACLSEENRSNKTPSLSPFLEDQVQDEFGSPGKCAQLTSLGHYGSPVVPFATHRSQLER